MRGRRPLSDLPCRRATRWQKWGPEAGQTPVVFSQSAHRSSSVGRLELELRKNSAASCHDFSALTKLAASVCAIVQLIARDWFENIFVKMASEAEIPKREPTPTSSLSSIPQKRALEEDHVPAVPSPLNPDVKPPGKTQTNEEMAPVTRDKPARVKKETLKKRESKGAFGGDSSRETPDPKHRDPPLNESSPLRFKLAPPKPSDFEPPRGPVFTQHHEVEGPDGNIEFFETSEQYGLKEKLLPSSGTGR